jgi:N-acetylglucosaminyldiphosphoundecaprenol N-acetyl-beta-D-mannosaminyltransferase
MANILPALLPRLAKNTESCIVENNLVTFVNLYSYSRINEHARVLSYFDKIGVDGISLCWLMNCVTEKRVERISFDMTSLAPLVFQRLIDQNKSIYLIGSENEEIIAAHSRLREIFPQLYIAGYRSGFFSSEQEREGSIRNIMEISPDVVLVGMGTPLQEQYLVDLWHAGWRGAGYTCGGFFHQAAQKLEYYPDWVDRLNLRWAYRIWDEPRLARRYGVDYPCSAISFLADALQFKYTKWKTGRLSG